WSTEQILALAPDAAAAKSGRDLAVARKWLTLGASDACAWGTLQGSGKDPYQTSVDLQGPAFKCTCPSRKFPGRDGLGLLLLLGQAPGALSRSSQPPEWTTEWLAKRGDQEERRKSARERVEAPVDPEAAARSAAAAQQRAALREAKVSAGLS